MSAEVKEGYRGNLKHMSMQETPDGKSKTHNNSVVDATKKGGVTALNQTSEASSRGHLSIDASRLSNA